MKINLKTKLNHILLIILCILPFELIAGEVNSIDEKQSKNQIIELDLKEARERVISRNNYSINEKIPSKNIDIYIKPYNLITDEIPDWWSERQAYDMSYLLMKALNHYPGINAELEKSWEENLLEKENILPKSSSNLSTNTQTIISPFLEEFKYQILTPKTRGIGIGYVAFNRKTCINETFLATKYQFESPLRSTLFLDDIISKQLLTKKKSGSSLNVNLLFAGVGGGKFKAPEKPIKEIVYNTVVDSAEGIYCSLSNNKQCLKYYNQREYNYPTVEKKRRKKKKNKSC